VTTGNSIPLLIRRQKNSISLPYSLTNPLGILIKGTNVMTFSRPRT